MLYRFWADLTDALKTGKPQSEARHGSESIFSQLYADPVRLEQFVEAMGAVSGGNFEALGEMFDFSGTRRCAARAPLFRSRWLRGILTCTTCPRICRWGRPLQTGRLPAQVWLITYRQGPKFLQAAVPEADVITLGMILHDWNLENKKMLIGKAYDALPPGGVLIAVEAIINAARRQHAFGLLMSLNMLIEFGEAFDYTGADSRAGAAGRFHSHRDYSAGRRPERRSSLQVRR